MEELFKFIENNNCTNEDICKLAVAFFIEHLVKKNASKDIVSALKLAKKESGGKVTKRHKKNIIVSILNDHKNDFFSG